MTGKADLADDLLQDTFLAFAKSAPEMDAQSDIGAYLFTIARNAWRAHRRWAFLDFARLLFSDEYQGQVDTRIEEQVAATEEMKQIEYHLMQLPEAQREVLWLVCYDGMNCEQVAAVLTISPENVRKRLERARKALEQSRAQWSATKLGAIR